MADQLENQGFKLAQGMIVHNGVHPKGNIFHDKQLNEDRLLEIRWQEQLQGIHC